MILLATRERSKGTMHWRSGDGDDGVWITILWHGFYIKTSMGSGTPSCAGTGSLKLAPPSL